MAVELLALGQMDRMDRIPELDAVDILAARVLVVPFLGASLVQQELPDRVGRLAGFGHRGAQVFLDPLQALLIDRITDGGAWVGAGPGSYLRHWSMFPAALRSQRRRPQSCESSKLERSSCTTRSAEAAMPSTH